MRIILEDTESRPIFVFIMVCLFWSFSSDRVMFVIYDFSAALRVLPCHVFHVVCLCHCFSVVLLLLSLLNFVCV